MGGGNANSAHTPTLPSMDDILGGNANEFASQSLGGLAAGALSAQLLLKHNAVREHSCFAPSVMSSRTQVTAQEQR